MSLGRCALGHPPYTISSSCCAGVIAPSASSAPEAKFKSSVPLSSKANGLVTAPSTPLGVYGRGQLRLGPGRIRRPIRPHPANSPKHPQPRPGLRLPWTGGRPSRRPHAHQVTWLDRAHLAVTDLGSDRIYFLRWSEAGSEIVGSLKVPAGCGPRHLTLTEDGCRQILTASGELSGTVSTWSRPTGTTCGLASGVSSKKRRRRTGHIPAHATALKRQLPRQQSSQSLTVSISSPTGWSAVLGCWTDGSDISI